MQACDKSIVLIGHMAAGKTSLGRHLATRLGLDFVDVDAVIENEAGSSIAHIFAHDGEAKFRGLEYRVLSRLLNDSVKVIATGGGLFAQPKCRALIAQAAISVWLKASVESLASRLTPAEIATRPLLAGKDDKGVVAALQALAKKRDPHYATADITVETDRADVAQAVADTLSALRQYLTQKQPANSSLQEDALCAPSRPKPTQLNPTQLSQ